MRFNWNEEQSLLRATLRDYLSDRYPFESRQRRVRDGFDPVIWKEMADLGILGLPFEEAYGGSGGSSLETLLVMEAFGRALVVEPFVPSIVLSGSLLRQLGSPAQRQQYIPPMISGDLRFACAFAEPQSRFNLSNIETRARSQGRDYCLNGRKVVVYGAPECQFLLVVARTSGDTTDPQGISVFLVPKDAPGVQVRAYRCVDGMLAADITLANVNVSEDNILGKPGEALSAIERATDEAIGAICAEAVGAMAALIEKCTDYSKSRQAFGKAIAEFQVIGHRLVDMRVAYEVASAMALKTAVVLRDRPGEIALTASACKVRICQEAGFIGKAAVQLHGAIGISDELDIGHYFKRLISIQTLFGGADFHLRRYIEHRHGS